MQKKLVKSSLIYVLLGFLAPAINFFLLPIYTRYLDKADYALITLATLVQAVFTPIIGLGMNGAFARYFYDHIDDNLAIDKLFSTTVLFYFFTALVLAGICSLLGPLAFQYFFSNDVFTFNKYGYVVLLTALAMNVQQIALSYYRNYEAIRKYAFWSILFFLTAAASIYCGVVVFRMGADGSIRGRMFGALATLVPLFVLFFRKRPLKFDWKLCRGMLPYALPLVPYLLLNVAFSNFDKALVERNFPLSQLGEYGFAILIASVVEIIINAVQSAIYPQLFRLLGQTDKPETEMQIVQIFRITLLVNMGVIAALISFTGLGLHLFINPRYWNVMDYFPLLCLVYIPRLLFTLWGIPIMYFKKTRVLPFANSLSLLIGIVLGTTLIKPLGIYALPCALFAVQLSQALSARFLNKRLQIDLNAFGKLMREYSLLVLLLALGLCSNFVYHHWIGSMYVYLPVFFILLLAIFLLYLPQVKSQYAQFMRKRTLKHEGA